MCGALHIDLLLYYVVLYWMALLGMALLAVGLWCYVVANGKLVLSQSSVCLQTRPQGIIIKGWLFLLLLPFSDQDRLICS